MTTIIFVRHTDVQNPADILYGRLPRFGLSSLGLKQAAVTAAVVAPMQVTAFYTSPMLRARQTSKIIAGKHPGVPVYTTRLLTEVLTGWQGRPHADLNEIGFNFYDNPLRPEDERLPDVWRRIQRFVQRMRHKYPEGTIIAVTHGDLVALARAGYLGLPIEIGSIRLPHPYPGKGGLLRLKLGRSEETYPANVEYYDPSGEDPRWSARWVPLRPDYLTETDKGVVGG
ncbi:MAG: histidine phosphatase family protein [Chloroflexota bacterium]